MNLHSVGACLFVKHVRVDLVARPHVCVVQGGVFVPRAGTCDMFAPRVVWLLAGASCGVVFVFNSLGSRAF